MTCWKERSLAFSERVQRKQLPAFSVAGLNYAETTSNFQRRCSATPSAPAVTIIRLLSYLPLRGSHGQVQTA